MPLKELTPLQEPCRQGWKPLQKGQAVANPRATQILLSTGRVDLEVKVLVQSHAALGTA